MHCTSMLYSYSPQHPQICVYSDASGSWGCAAFTGTAWFQFRWPLSGIDSHISTKEMIPVVIAAMVWGRTWQGLSICFHSYNTAVVALLNSGSVRDYSLMHLHDALRIVCSCKINFIRLPITIDILYQLRSFSSPTGKTRTPLCCERPLALAFLVSCAPVTLGIGFRPFHSPLP